LLVCDVGVAPDALVTPRFWVFPAGQLAKVIPTTLKKGGWQAHRFFRSFLQAHQKLSTGILAILDHYTNWQKCFSQNFVCASKSMNVQELSQRKKIQFGVGHGHSCDCRARGFSTQRDACGDVAPGV
jgi:hypothetical protein